MRSATFPEHAEYEDSRLQFDFLTVCNAYVQKIDRPLPARHENIHFPIPSRQRTKSHMPMSPRKLTWGFEPEATIGDAQDSAGLCFSFLDAYLTAGYTHTSSRR